jgi:hypothetical protein
VENNHYIIPVKARVFFIYSTTTDAFNISTEIKTMNNLMIVCRIIYVAKEWAFY